MPCDGYCESSFKWGCLMIHQRIAKLTAAIGSAEHREVARECVRESLVLLKNENMILPLSKHLNHLVVIGEAADDLGVQCGGWTIDWQGRKGEVTHGGTTILSAIRQTVSPETKVTFSADGSERSECRRHHCGGGRNAVCRNEGRPQKIECVAGRFGADR